jgi:hypothetical protein
MFIFIVPFRSRQTTNHWDHACTLLKRTLKSICNQTNDDFRVLVVCSEVPENIELHPQVEFIPMSLPTPTNLQEGRRDAKIKARIGCFYAQQYNPDFIMSVDADDLVSNRLVAYTKQHPNQHGFCFQKGYIYVEGDDRLLLKRQKFHQWCGTCNIFRADIFDIPGSIEFEYFSDEIIAKTYCLHHNTGVDIMQERGLTMNSVPFPSAIYSIGNGVNMSAIGKQKLQGKRFLTHLKRVLFDYKSITPKIKREFSL